MQLLICLAHHPVGVSSTKGAAGSLFLKPPLVTPSEQHYVGTFIALFISDIMDIDYVSTFSRELPSPRGLRWQHRICCGQGSQPWTAYIACTLQAPHAPQCPRTSLFH
jgi:hypothetical protein